MSGGGGESDGRGASVAGYDNTGPELGYSGPSTATGAMEAGVDPGLAHAVFGQGRQSFGDKSLDALDALAQHGLKNVFDRETVVKNAMNFGLKALAGIHGGPLGAAATVAIEGLLDDTPKTDPLKHSGVSFDPTNTGITTNPNLGTDPDRVGYDGAWGVNPKGMKVSSKELPASVVPSIEQMLDWNPLQFDTNFNTNITHPALTPEARQLDPNAANKVLDAMGIPWGVNAISNISHSDTEREYAERAAAERALYSQIAQQITQAAGQSTPSTGTTVAGPTGGTTGGGTGGTGGGGSGGGGGGGGGGGNGGGNGGGTRPKPKPPVGKQDPPPRKADPIDILVKTILTPKKQMSQIAKHAQKSLRQGRTPDMSTLSDYQQDLVSAILNPPKPAVSSNYSSIANR